MRKIRKISIFLIIILIIQTVPLAAIAATDYTPQADTLKQLGLFSGTDVGYELDNSTTRAQIGVMTVRLLGKDADARSGAYTHPFTDVPEWADPYIGYLYHYKITTGISATEFGSSQQATAIQFAALVLRALGYDDFAGDFSWEKSLDKMVSLGIMTTAQAAELSTGGLRGYIVAISHLSLFAKLKGTATTLLEKLYIQDKAITPAQLKAASVIDSRVSMLSNIFGLAKPYPEGEPLGSEEIFTKVSNAVFKLETQFLSGSDWGSGSGFFITSDGIAVTNLHVIDFISSATITTPSGATYPVEGVLAINHDADLAIIKVKGSGFPYLEVGDPAALRAAQRIYCIGSPYGLDNTFTDGLVSNPNREYEGYTYIQISAPIAPGSSGGALLNEYGQVVGVTAAGFDQGSVNLAAKITDLVGAFRFPQVRSIKYLQAHSQFGAIPVTDTTYTRIDSDSDKPVQTMKNDTIMYGTIKSPNDVHYYALDVKNAAEMIVSLTSNEQNSAGLKFEVYDPSGKLILTPRHYSGEAFSVATGPGFVKGLYNVKVFVKDSGEDWRNVNYELFWLYHDAYSVSEEVFIFFEFEPNNTPEFANYFPDSATYVSSISNKNDVDYYTFTLQKATDYYAMLISDHFSSALNAEVFDSGNKSVGKFSFNGFFESFDARLPAGTYYVKVSVKDTGITWDNEPYVLTGWNMS